MPDPEASVSAQTFPQMNQQILPNVNQIIVDNNSSMMLYYVLRKDTNSRGMRKQLVDKNYKGSEKVQQISMQDLKNKKWYIVLKENNNERVEDLQGYKPEDLMIVSHATYQRDRKINGSSKRKKTAINDSGIVLWYLIGPKNRAKQVINPEDYKGHEDKIKSIFLEELSREQLCLVSKSTYKEVKNPKEHDNPQDLIIISRNTYCRKNRNNQGEDNSKIIYFITLPEDIRQVIDPKDYQGNKKIESISLEKLKEKQWYIILKDTHEKVINPEKHKPQDLIIIPHSTYCKKYKKNNPTKNQDSNPSSVEKENTGKTINKRKAAPPAGPSKRKKTSATTEPLALAVEESAVEPIAVEEPKTASSTANHLRSALLFFDNPNTVQTVSLDAQELGRAILPSQENNIQDDALCLSNDSDSRFNLFNTLFEENIFREKIFEEEVSEEEVFDVQSGKYYKLNFK